MKWFQGKKLLHKGIAMNFEDEDGIESGCFIFFLVVLIGWVLYTGLTDRNWREHDLSREAKEYIVVCSTYECLAEPTEIDGAWYAPVKTESGRIFFLRFEEKPPMRGSQSIKKARLFFCHSPQKNLLNKDCSPISSNPVRALLFLGSFFTKIFLKTNNPHACGLFSKIC